MHHHSLIPNPVAATGVPVTLNNFTRDPATETTGLRFDEPISPQHLPKTTQSFIRLIGMNATMQLLEHFGGRPLYIPKRVHPNCALLNALQRRDVQSLSRHYGGETIDIPKVDTIKRHWRNLSIAAASAAGVSRAELVAHYGLSRRQIGNIRRQYRGLIDDLSQDAASARGH